MNKLVSRLAIGVGVLLGVAVLAIIGVYFSGRSKLSRAYDVEVAQISIPSSEEDRARGEHLVRTVSDCVGCHGEDLGGALFSDDPALGVLYAPNLTPGAGGTGQAYTDADWIRALRHGIGGDGRALILMPSQAYTEYSTEDLGAVIAYLKALPPVDNVTPERKGTFLLTMLTGIGAFPTAYDLIDQERVWEDSLSSQVSIQSGEYLVNISACRDCHGQNLSGRTEENGPPPGPNLTSGGELQEWDYEDFASVIREGITPDGRELADEMPWKAYRGMSDEELQSIWLYLQNVPSLATASE